MAFSSLTNDQKDMMTKFLLENKIEFSSNPDGTHFAIVKMVNPNLCVLN